MPPNLFLNIPVPAANGSGSAVDVSSMGATKSVVIGGNIDANVTIEYATDAGGLEFAPLVSFQGSGSITANVAAHWMRATVIGYRSGMGLADVGASASGASFAQLIAPPGDGAGVPVNIAGMAPFKTIVVQPGFTGAVNIEISEAGSEYAQVLTFDNGGGASITAYGALARVTRVGSSGGIVPDVWIGAAGDGGGGGGTSGQEFRHVVTLAESALASFPIVLPVIEPDTNYNASVTGGGLTFQVTFDCPIASYAVGQFVVVPSGLLAAGDTLLVSIRR